MRKNWEIVFKRSDISDQFKSVYQLRHTYAS